MDAQYLKICGDNYRENLVRYFMRVTLRGNDHPEAAVGVIGFRPVLNPREEVKR